MPISEKYSTASAQHVLSENDDHDIQTTASAYYNARRAPTILDQTRVRRLFSSVQIFFFALTYMSSWEALCGNIALVLYNGGPSSLAWGILVVSCGALTQSASMAEMASIQPIAGAQYHWTAFLAPQRYRRFITWIQGWITWFAWISTLVGVANVTAYILQGIIIMNYPDYVPQRWHLTLIIYAMLLVQCLMNIYMFWLVPWLEVFAGVLHVVLFVIFIVVLGVMAPKQDAEFVFFARAAEGASGWSNNFVSWNVGLITPCWCFVGFDGAVHMSEETRRAKSAIPKAMFLSIAINAVMAYAMAIMILFSMGSLDDLLSSPYPILTILINATGSIRAATAMCCGLLFISLSANLASITSVSRLTWAWSRDGALPAYFSYINPKYRIPIRALCLPTLISMLIALLNIASTAAFGAFIALSTISLFTSYTLAISCLLYARLRHHDTLTPGAWTLSRYGVPINIFAILYSVYMFVWLPFPGYFPVEAGNMNYSIVLWAGAVLFAVGSWWAWGRKRWPGLNEEVVIIVMGASDKNTKD